MHIKDIIAKVQPVLSRLPFWRKSDKPDAAPGKTVITGNGGQKTRISAEKQAKLEELCHQLFKKKEWITSGKLQFIGLSKVKRRLGKKWEGVCKIVFKTVDDVIERHLGKGDIFIRYKEDIYILIFAHASLEEGQEKSKQIAEEIQRELFALEEKELRDLEIRRALAEIRTNMMSHMDFPDFLDALDIEFTEIERAEQVRMAKAEKKKAEPVDVETIEIDARNYKPKVAPLPTAEEVDMPKNIGYAYMPIWDIRRKALTTYLCLPFLDTDKEGAFQKYQNLYNSLSDANKPVLERCILETVIAELDSMIQDGRQMLIACPVQHETLYKVEDYERYKKLLEEIPIEQRQYLVFYVMNFDRPLPVKHAYWFAKPLRQYGRHVFAEIPLRRDINFNYLRHTGVDVAGVRLQHSLESEEDIFNLLTAFAVKAKALKIPKTFAMQVSSVSLATSAVCAKFDFLGGPIIQDVIAKPEKIQRYQHEDLLMGLKRKKS